MRTSVVVRVVLGAMFLIGCRKNNATNEELPRPVEAPAPTTRLAEDSGGLTASAPVRPRGKVTLVIQTVSSRCATRPGGDSASFVGHDLILEADDGSGAKPDDDYVFCPKAFLDAAKGEPKFNPWGVCSRFPSCAVTAADAGDRVEVTCGKEVIVVQTDGRRTWITTPWGEREIAPRPMVIAPPRRTERTAYIDC